WSLSASPDGKWLAIGEAENGALSIWDLGSRQQKARLEPGDGKVYAVFSPAQPLLAYSAVRGPLTNRQAMVRLWAVVSAQTIGEVSLPAQCMGLSFSSDGQTLVVSTAWPDNRITLWRLADRARLASYPAPQSAADDAIPFAVTRDASAAAFGGGGPNIH